MTDGAADASPGSPRVGATFGRYQIEAELGHGGQGRVFRAHDSRLGRKVALKVLALRGPLTERTALRLTREGMLAARIDHPSACEVYDCGVEAGQPYLAMRLVDGVPLTELTRASAPLDRPSLDRAAIAQRLLWGEQIADALHCAHQLGVLHRDVKPGNIMIARDGSAVLLDFGLAKETSGSELSLTADGMLCGTPDYMSPEQLTLDAPPLDGRTDVYSLGATLYELIAQRRPFGTSTELFPTLASRQQLADLRALDRAWNRDLRAVLERALAVDRAERYDSARAFADDLRRCRQGLPVAARPAGALLRLRRWAERNRALAAASLLAIASLLIGLVFSLHWAVAADTARALSEWRRYGSSLALAARLLGDGDRAGTLLALADCEPEQRGYEWQLLRAETDVALSRQRPGAAPIAQLAHADGRVTITLTDGSVLEGDGVTAPRLVMPPWRDDAVVAADAAGGLRVLALERAGETRLHFARGDQSFELPCPVRQPRLRAAPDGSGACVLGYETTLAYSFAARGAIGPKLARGSAHTALFAATRDGLRLVLPLDIRPEQRCVVEVRRWPDLALQAEFGITDGYCDAAALSADGRRLLLATSNRRDEHRTGAVQALHLADGTHLARYSGALGQATALAVSPDDEWVAVAEATGTVRVLDGALTTTLGTRLGHADAVVALCALDERRLLAGSRDAELRLFAPQAPEMVALTAWPVRGIDELRFDPPGNTLWLASAFAVRGYDLTGRAAPRTLPGGARALGLSRDGTTLWTTSLVSRSPIHGVDPATATRRVVAGAQPDWVRAALFDPDAGCAWLVQGVTPPQLVQLRIAADGSVTSTMLGALAPTQTNPRLARSRDGRWVAAACGTELSTFDAQLGTSIARATLPAAILALDFGADARLAIATAGARLLVTEPSLSTRAELTLASELRSIAAHPSQPRVLAACRGGTLTICSTDPLQPLVTLPRFAQEITRLAFDPRGERLAVGFTDSHVEVLASASGTNVHPQTDLPEDAIDATLTPPARIARRITARHRRYGYQTGQAFAELAERPNLPRFVYEICAELLAQEAAAAPAADTRAVLSLALMRAGRDREALAQCRAARDALAPDDRNAPRIALQLAVVEAMTDGSKASAPGIDERASAATPCLEAALVLGRRDGVAAARWLREHDAASPARDAALRELPDGSLRRAIAELCEAFPDAAAALRDAAWLVVSTPDLDPTLYRQAAHWAAHADALAPHEARPELLAGARVRLGQPDDALAILAGLGELDPARHAVRLFFTTLAEAHRGHAAAAERAAGQLAVQLGNIRLRDHELRASLRSEVQRVLGR